MTNLNILQNAYPVGTPVEIVVNRIVMFSGTVIDHTRDDAAPFAIVQNEAGETRKFAHNTLVERTR